MLMRQIILVSLACLWGCTDAGIYSQNGPGPTRNDRGAFSGTVCVPLATGLQFPVKVLYVFQAGQGVSAVMKDQGVSFLNSLPSLLGLPSYQFSVEAFDTTSASLQPTFVTADKLAQNAVATKYSLYQPLGPVSIRSALTDASSILSGDMVTACSGAVARTRYLVVLVVGSSDNSCSNAQYASLYNSLFDAQCEAYLKSGQAEACNECELASITAQIKALQDQYQAGQVTIFPIDASGVSDPVLNAQIAAIAAQGGSLQQVTSPGNLQALLKSLNYQSIQPSLQLKQFAAFNRNAQSRKGQLLTDSDGDGLSDVDEASLGTDPASPDSDGDGLMDGLEVRYGLDPKTPNVISGCDRYLDTDGDRLNDCEERVLGTDPCLSDTDGDGFPDLVEFLSATNPLLAERLGDDDGDGVINSNEILAHSDAHSADLAYIADRGYNYSVTPAPPLADGRQCYNVDVNNVDLVPTVARPNLPFAGIPAGTNDIYLYAQIGKQNDPHGSGFSTLNVQSITFTPPKTRSPAGVIPFSPDQYVVGY